MKNLNPLLGQSGKKVQEDNMVIRIKPRENTFIALGGVHEILKKKIEQDKLDKEAEERISKKDW